MLAPFDIAVRLTIHLTVTCKTNCTAVTVNINENKVFGVVMFVMDNTLPPSHGENRGSSPLGSAKDFKVLSPASDKCYSPLGRYFGIDGNRDHPYELRRSRQPIC